MRTDTLRAEQAAIIDGYTGGKVGIAAVPGSGKTFTLAHLAARLIADQRLGPDQEVLIVTFTNSAVNSFQTRIARILQQQYKLIPYVGYRVRTLHGLAHDIVRERPALVGLADDFAILDERLALDIQRESVDALLGTWWDRLALYLDPNVSEKGARRALGEDLPTLVARFIKTAKDWQLDPDALAARLASADERFDLAQFALAVYRAYQRSLTYRGAVDFDDLVRLALEALDRDAGYLLRLRERWPFILEDEAQDSSRLQEEMLRRLSANRNWVRVGDPNQAINTTFTTADPQHLLDFLNGADVDERPLSVSGRSTASLIDLANELVRWTVEEHPTPDLRSAFEYQSVTGRGPLRGVLRPALDDDPQPSPPDDQTVIVVDYAPSQKITPEQELDRVVFDADYALEEWLAELADLPPDERPTVAALVPENSRGFKLAEVLRRRGLPFTELLRSTSETRQTVKVMQAVLDYLAEPTDLRRLKAAYWGLMSQDEQDRVNHDADLRDALGKAFARWRNIEEFLWPEAGAVPPFDPAVAAFDALRADLERFRQRVRRWLDAASLPIDQLILTFAQDVFTEPVDMALAHKVAGLLRSVAQTHPDWRLPQFVEELRVISSNQRRFIGFDDEAGFEPKPGEITLATMHAAKGLEWDRVYLLAVSSYGFPSAQPYDAYIGEKWYARPSYDGLLAHLNLEAEVEAQLQAVRAGALDTYVEGDATLTARLDYAKERLRLLYVGLTRAKRELIVTWNMGRYWNKGREHENTPALPVVMLKNYVDR